MAEPIKLEFGAIPWGPIIELTHPSIHILPEQHPSMQFLHGVFIEKEPNNTPQAGNDLGTFSSSAVESILIHGHINGKTDPFDYFTFTSPSAGEFIVDTYRGGNSISSHTLKATDAGQKFWYDAETTGSADFDYVTHITFFPPGTGVA